MTNTKKCSFCAEDIKAEAIKCRHCGSALDGSSNEKNVTVSGIDPFAEYHTPIQGKKKGKITLLGYIGIVLGLLAIITGINTFGESEFNGLVTIGFGFIFVIMSYLWVRK